MPLYPKSKISYADYLALQERFSQVEAEYLETWKNLKSSRKRSKKLAALSAELIALDDKLSEIKRPKF